MENKISGKGRGVGDKRRDNSNRQYLIKRNKDSRGRQRGSNLKSPVNSIAGGIPKSLISNVSALSTKSAPAVKQPPISSDLSLSPDHHISSKVPVNQHVEPQVLHHPQVNQIKKVYLKPKVGQRIFNSVSPENKGRSKNNNNPAANPKKVVTLKTVKFSSHHDSSAQPKPPLAKKQFSMSNQNDQITSSINSDALLKMADESIAMIDKQLHTVNGAETGLSRNTSTKQLNPIRFKKDESKAVIS